MAAFGTGHWQSFAVVCLSDALALPLGELSSKARLRGCPGAPHPFLQKRGESIMLESIKCSASGAYYLRGQWVPADAQAPAALAAAGVTAEQAGQAYKGTMAYGILTAHNTSGNDRDLRIKFDAMASHDITFVGIIQTARASGLEKFPIPYVLTNCHNSLCAVGGTINEDDHRFGLSAAKKYGGIFVPPHMAVIHQYMRETLCGLRQDDPWLRLPHPLRRTGHHGHRRGRRRAGKAAAGPHLRCGPSRRGGHLPDRRSARRLRPPRCGHCHWWASCSRAAMSRTRSWSLWAPASPPCGRTTRNAIDAMTTETTCLSSIWETDEKTRQFLTVHGRAGDYKPLHPAELAYYDGVVERGPFQDPAHDRPALAPLQRLSHRGAERQPQGHPPRMRGERPAAGGQS